MDGTYSFLLLIVLALKKTYLMLIATLKKKLSAADINIEK